MDQVKEEYPREDTVTTSEIFVGTLNYYLLLGRGEKSCWNSEKGRNGKFFESNGTTNQIIPPRSHPYNSTSLQHWSPKYPE